jgi:hypothetical protein
MEKKFLGIKILLDFLIARKESDSDFMFNWFYLGGEKKHRPDTIDKISF